MRTPLGLIRLFTREGCIAGHISSKQPDAIRPELTRHLLRRKHEIQQEKILAHIVVESQMIDVPQRVTQAKLPGDRAALRGIPCEGFGGAVRGTRPDQMADAGRFDLREAA